MNSQTTIQRQSFTTVIPSHWSVADLQHHLGNIPAERIRLVPPPGSATETDVQKIEETENRYFELDNGVLVE